MEKQSRGLAKKAVPKPSQQPKEEVKIVMAPCLSRKCPGRKKLRFLDGVPKGRAMLECARECQLAKGHAEHVFKVVGRESPCKDMGGGKTACGMPFCSKVGPKEKRRKECSKYCYLRKLHCARTYSPGISSSLGGACGRRTCGSRPPMGIDSSTW